MRQLFFGLLLLLTGMAIGFFVGRGSGPGSAAAASGLNIALASDVDLPASEAAAENTELAPVPTSAERSSAGSIDSTGASMPDLEREFMSLAARFPAPQGEMSLDGSVLGEDGGPIEGATVLVTGPRRERIASRVAQDPAKVGRGFDGQPRINPMFSLYAQQLIQSLNPAGSSVTDAKGHFLLSGLAEGTYQIEVLAEDFVFERSSGTAGETVEIYGRPVVTFELSVLDPSGVPPAEATIMLHGGKGRDQRFQWTPDAPELRVPSRLVALQAFTGEINRVGQGEYRASARTSILSLDWDSDGRGPHALELKAFPSVHVDVVAGPDAGQPFEPWCELVRDSQRIEAKQEAGRPFAAFDVAPGPYTVEVGRGDGPAEVTRQITVGEGRTELSVELGPLDPARYMIVHCVDAAGRPVLDIWNFGASIRMDRKSMGTSIRTKARPNGEYWLSLERGMLGSGTTRRAEITSLTLIARSPSQGEIQKEVDPHAQRVEFLFQKPCDLIVEVDGALSPGLSVTVERPKQEGEGWQQSGSRTDVPGDGSVAFQSLAPGSARVVLRHVDSPWQVHMAAVTIELRGGKNEVRLTAGETHELVVLVPDLESKRFELYAEEDGEFVRKDYAEPDENDRLTFQFLPAGRYRVQYRGKFGPIFAHYDVPCGEVVFEPSLIDGFEVISVREGSVAEELGLRVGDVLLGVDHIRPSQGTFVLEFTSRAVRPEGTLLKLRRSGTVVEIPVRLNEPPTRPMLGHGARFKTLSQ